MKTTQKSIVLAAALSLTLSAPATVLAHSGHNHEELPVTWQFTDATQDKVKTNFSAASGKIITGLSQFEQKKLDRYGIQVGATFKSEIAGHPVKVKRTTMGLEVLGVQPFDLTSVWQIPIRKAHGVSLVATGSVHHEGHDHAVKPYEWEFTQATQNLIVKRVAERKSAFIGLNEFEQKLMDRYSLKIGNIFMADVQGQKMRVERTSGGIRVQSVDDNPTLASATGMSRM